MGKVIEGPFGKRDSKERIAASIFENKRKSAVAPYFDVDETIYFIENPLDANEIGRSQREVDRLFRIEEDRLRDPRFVSRQRLLDRTLEPIQWKIEGEGIPLRVRTKLSRLPRGRRTPVYLTISSLTLPEVGSGRNIDRLVSNIARTPSNVQPLRLRRILTQGRMNALPMIIVPYDISSRHRPGLALGEAPRVQLESALFQSVASAATEASKRPGYRNTNNPIVLIPDRRFRRFHITDFNSLLARSFSRAKSAMNRGRALRAIGTIGAIGAMGSAMRATQKLKKLKEEGRL